MPLADTGIILEVERGKTTINNMDLLDFWKCHICAHADYLFLMVPTELRDYERLLAIYRSTAEQLVPVLEAMALASVREVLPGAERIEVEGRINEDWLSTLRLLRVLGGDGGVLFDVAVGHDDERVEELIDEVGVEYLDLLDLTGDDFMGHREIGV